MYEVILSAEAEKIYASADQALAKKIARCFEQLEKNPYFHPNIKSLKGNLDGYSRYRIGDYRVIYQINGENKQVIISNIVHRSEAYE